MVRTFIGWPLSLSAKANHEGRKKQDSANHGFPDTDLLSQVLGELAEFGNGLRVVCEGNLHVTLKFLGETEAAVIPDLIAAMSEISRSVIPFETRIAGIGVFPNLRRPSVIWAGVHPSEEFRKLAQRLEVAVAGLGFAPETRGYTPHLTLARLRQPCPKNIHRWIDKYADTEFLVSRVARIRLYESVLNQRGVRYETIAESPLLIE